jgi:phosphatidylglycerol---prolipoprotein diacylglyceryl transferase
MTPKQRLRSHLSPIHIWRLTIPTFGLMVALAMLISFYVLRADLVRRGIAKKDSGLAEAFIAIPCLAGIVGAKLYHVLEAPRDLVANPFGQIFSQYGFAWLGGLIAGLAAFVWLARKYKIRLLTILDAGSPAAALGYGIGRLGCFLSGDGDYGIPTSLPWGVSFPHGIVPTTARVHPTPIYEFIVACAIAAFLWKLGNRQAAQAAAERSTVSRPQQSTRTPLVPIESPGFVFASYLILTGLARFLVEFIRINPRSFVGMTNAQIGSLISIAGGAVIYRIVRQPRLTSNRPVNPKK